MESKSFHDVEGNYQNLLKLEPKLVPSTVPSNAKEQKELFLTNALVIPDHNYPKLKVATDRLEAIANTGQAIITSPAFDKKHRDVYEEFTEWYYKKTQLMQAMDAVKTAPTKQERDAARAEFMQLNIELYNVPEQATYASLLQEKVAAIMSQDLHENAQVIRDELLEVLPATITESPEKIERFQPSPETVAWMHDAVNTLYGSMLAHVPERESFDVLEARDIFAVILEQEFGGAANEWRVDVEPAKSINVISTEKRIVIPENRGELTHEMLCKLVVHEIGVHVLRSITGEQADVGPLRTGLADYYDAEEGLGKVMEQALVGEFGEAGIDHYITAGAAYFESMNFREAYEMKWRLGVLTKLSPNEPLTETAIIAAKNAAYGGVMRIFRGTDELPWFKDLAYYNGSVETWKFLESIRGDDYRLTLFLMGKLNTSQGHLRTILESSSL